MNYEDLKLGEKAKEAYMGGKGTDYIEKNCPVYLNTKPVIYGLNVTDLVIAAELAGIPTLLVGDTGSGKSQLVQDILNSHFNGNENEGGHGTKIRGKPELDIYDEVYTRLNLEKAIREPTENIHSLIHFIDELNRTPPVTQNQFFGLGDGFLEYDGRKLPIGKNGYFWTVATANLGNGEFNGTFETDKALYNRFVVIDLDCEMFRPTDEDRILIKQLRAANPKIKESPLRDLSEEIIKASGEISEISVNPGLESMAVANYIEFGLENCEEGRTSNSKPSKKGKTWPYVCQECPKNVDGKYICSLIKQPQPRTLQSTIRYASALDYLIRLKDPSKITNAVDLMFKAFELTAAYQQILNPGVLRSEYSGQNPNFMSDVVEKLKNDFRLNEDMIMTTLEGSLKGERNKDYFEYDGKIEIGYHGLNEVGKAKVRIIDPFTNKRAIGMGWVEKLVDLNIEIHGRRK